MSNFSRFCRWFSTICVCLAIFALILSLAFNKDMHAEISREPAALFFIILGLLALVSTMVAMWSSHDDNREPGLVGLWLKRKRAEQVHRIKELERQAKE